MINNPDLRQNPNRRAPLAAILSFSLDRSAEVAADISDADRRFRLDLGRLEAGRHEIPIAGMRPDRDHHVSIQAGQERLMLPVYRTPPLPGGFDFPPGLRVNIERRVAREPGIVLLSVHRLPTGRYQLWSAAKAAFGFNWGMILALDSDNEVCWFYTFDSFLEGVDRLPNGNIIFHTWDCRTTEIDLLGNTVNQWYAVRHPRGSVEGAIGVDAAGLHHQPFIMPNGNFLVLIADAFEVDDFYTDQWNLDAPSAPARIVGDGVAEMDPQTGELLWKWWARDHLSPKRIGYGSLDDYWDLRGFKGAFDWTHGNGAAYDANDDSVIVSLRHMDALLKVDRVSGDIRWILGEPEDWGPLQAKCLRPINLARWPYHGHNPRLTKRGTIMFFDNGTWGARPPLHPVPVHRNFSRAVEYLVEEAAMTVEEVWASDRKLTDTAWLAPDMGDAHLLPATGNRMAVWAHCVRKFEGQVYSNRDMSGTFFNDFWMPSLLREFGGMDGAETVFELEMYDPDELVSWGIYGCKVIPGFHS